MEKKKVEYEIKVIEEITELVHNTLDFCGNTLEAVKDYCKENNIKFDNDIEQIRFHATMNYGK